MRTSILALTAGLAAQALADGASIVSAIYKIGNSTEALDQSVTEFKGEILPVGIFAILQDQKQLVSDLEAGTSTAKASAPLDINEALAVYTATQALVGTVNSTLANIQSAKPKFDHLIIASPLLLHDLKQDKELSGEFGNAVVDKVPDFGKPLALPLLAQINEAFDKAIATYSGGPSLPGLSL